MSVNWQSALDREIATVHPQLVALRRHLHQHPELSSQEFETTRQIQRALEAAGIESRAGDEGRGLIVDSLAAAGAPRIALRADIDALPIHETRACSYRSERDGVMHACGHDGHTATVLGAVIALKSLYDRGELPGPLAWRAVFQPAEETLLGARQMIAQGALEGVTAIFSLHMDPSRPVGTIGMCSGPFTANCDTLKIVVTGKGGHGARPHATIDPIAAAVQLVNALYVAVPRNIDSQDAVVLSFGHFAAGDTANVIPETALLRGTLRTLDQTVRREAKTEIARICDGLAVSTRTTIDLEWGASIDGVMNDPAMADVVRRAAREVLEGPDAVQEITRPSMGSEDFASYCRQTPGCMFRLGCASPAVGNSGLHTPTFDLDEQALAIGARILARAAIYALTDRPTPLKRPPAKYTPEGSNL